MNLETGYARTDDGVYIAYQTLGDGPVALALGGGFLFIAVAEGRARWQRRDTPSES